MNSMIDEKLPEFLRDLIAPDNSGAGSLAAVSRRQFFKLSGITGGGLVLGLAVKVPAASAQQEAGAMILTPYVQIQPDGRINIFSKNPECGQGIKTGLPLIIAEELDADWNAVDVLQADIDLIYGVQFAGGSQSTPQNWMPMRQAGATARAMLLAAAAQTLNVPVAELTTQNSRVLHAASNREFGYGEFAELAATMPVPAADQLVLKNPAQFTLLGRRYSGVDNESIVRGRSLFGIDQHLDGMLYATFTKAPAINATARSFNREHILSLDGVVDAFILEPAGYAVSFGPGSGAHFGGVAIVARTTWAAIKARQELEVEWDNSTADTAASWSASADRAYYAGPRGPRVIQDKGDVDAAMASADTVVEAFYEYPYVNHVNLEPQNCTALFGNGRVEIWAPSQTPQSAEQGVAAMTGLAPENVVLHQTRIGGGFGRRLNNDFVNEVVAIARRMEGTPIKLQWTREDDMAYDYFRPGGFHSYRAALDENGRMTAFDDHFINFSEDGENPVGMGALALSEFPMPYLQNARATETLEKATIPTGPMRAPRSNAFGFAFQSFLHECAEAGDRDYRDFLLEILAMTPPNQDEVIMDAQRAANVIRTVTERAEWGRPMPEGRGLGLAFYYSHSGYVAQVADVSVGNDKAVTVHKVWSVQDFGFIHNLSAAENQIQGSVLDGLSQLMYAKSTFENGVIQQSNFHQYPMLRMPHAPEVEVFFLQPADVSPTGAGEPGLPPALPAIANAIFSASGERVRKTPLIELGYRFA